MIRILRRLLKERSGNFAMMFALMTIPIAIAIGAATDFSYALTVKSQLQNSADAAAVSALAEQSVAVISSLQSGTTGDIEVGNSDALAFFKANVDSKISAYITSYTINVKRTATQFTSEVKFTASVPTSFLGIVGKTSVLVSGVAQANYVPATYVDFYMMLDNSPSMGLGATTSDITTMESNTSDTCAFACHIENAKSDNYSLAKSLGVTTRIQLVSQAAQAMMSTAKTTRKYSDQYRMAVYSMGAKATAAQLTNVAPMSSNLDDVADKTATIDLMSVPYHGYNSDQMTDLLTDLTSLNTTIGSGGTGASSTDRQKVLFLVSDGVEDANRPDGCLKQYVDGSKRCQAPIDYSICTKIKDAGVRIAVLYTTYQPLTTNWWYNKYISPFQTQISTNMKSCATNGLFFEVSPSQGITEAMNALFLKVVNLPKLTM